MLRPVCKYDGIYQLLGNIRKSRKEIQSKNSKMRIEYAQVSHT